MPMVQQPEWPHLEGLWLRLPLIAAATVAGIEAALRLKQWPRGERAAIGPAMAMVAAAGENCGCATPEGRTATINGTVVNAQRLRAVQLLGVEGKTATLGDLVGPSGKAVVVFLRHLG